jgi:hypothetical protein
MKSLSEFYENISTAIKKLINNYVKRDDDDDPFNSPFAII